MKELTQEELITIATNLGYIEWVNDMRDKVTGIPDAIEAIRDILNIK